MVEPFHLVSPPAFERDVRKRTRRNPGLVADLEEMRAILREDPYNRTRRYDIERLTDVKQGDGQWRIRSGDYRIRYDIVGRDVVLHSFRHRREAYGKRK